MREDIIRALQNMVDRIGEPKLQKRFENFDRVLVMSFKDEEFDVKIRFENGNATVEEGMPENPDMTVTTDSVTILQVLDGSLSAMRAFMGGQIVAKGSTRDLLKLQHQLKAQ